MLRKLVLAVAAGLLFSACQTAATPRATTSPTPAAQPSTPTTVAVATAAPTTAPTATTAATPTAAAVATSASPTPATTVAPGRQPTSQPVATAAAAVPDTVLQAARAALAQRLNVDPASVRLVSAERVDWPDGSLGCPKPGMMYVQMVTPGYKLTVSAGNQNYEYHSDTVGHVVSCS